LLGQESKEAACKVSNFWIFRSQSLLSEAGQGDLNGVEMNVLRISMAVSGEVDMPATARTLALLMERAFLASSTVRHLTA